MGKSQQSSGGGSGGGPLPKNWPPNLPYLTGPAHSPNLSPSHLAQIRIKPSSSSSSSPDSEPSLPVIPKSYKPGPCPLVRITPITDPLRMFFFFHIIKPQPPRPSKKNLPIIYFG